MPERASCHVLPSSFSTYSRLLLQVNASPSMAYTTPSDRVMKASLINDIINIVMSPTTGFPEYAKIIHSFIS